MTLAPRLCLTVLLLLTTIAAAAQCVEKTIAVGLVVANGRLIRNAKPELLIGKAGKKQVSIQKMDWDNGPRRIIVVFDLNRELSREARKVEAIMVRRLIEVARPQDTFAFKVANGNRNLRFGSDPEGRKQLLGDIDNGLQVEKSENSLVDVLAEVIGWLDNPQPGDSVVVFSDEPDKKSRAKFKDVRQSLWSAGIRVYDISLTMLFGGTYSTVMWGDSSVNTILSPNRESLHNLSWATGGVGFVFPTDNPVREFKVDDKVSTMVKDATDLMYSAIIEFYRTVVEAKLDGEKSDFWQLDFVPDVRKQFPDARVLYPRGIYPCR